MIDKNEIKKEMLKGKKNRPSIGTWLFNTYMYVLVDKIIITEVIIFSLFPSYLTSKFILFLFFKENLNDILPNIFISVFLFLIAYLPLAIFVIEETFIVEGFIIDRREDIKNYNYLNKSIVYNGKYYSLWYILFNYEKFDSILISSKINFKEDFLNSRDFYYYILTETSVKRDKRKNWRNSLPTNRLLSFGEYLKIKKKIIKSNKVDAENKDIEAFQKYHDL